MIRAEKAARIMRLYERDYDNFLNYLRGKAKSKKKTAGPASKAAQQADANLKEAEAHKQGHLAQKAKDLLDKAGGIDGVKQSAQNVMTYIKSDNPSDYSINMGDTTNQDDKTPAPGKTNGSIPPMAMYIGGTIAFLLLLYGASVVLKKKQGQDNPNPAIQETIPSIQTA